MNISLIKRTMRSVASQKGNRIFKNGPICGRQPLKRSDMVCLGRLKFFKTYRLSSTNFTWSILEYFVSNICRVWIMVCMYFKVNNIGTRTTLFGVIPVSFLSFGCPKINFWSLTRRHPHSPDVNHCAWSILPESHWKPNNEVGSQSQLDCISGIQLGNPTVLFSLLLA